LGIHRDAFKAAFGQWGLPALERRLGWQPSRFLADRAEAERTFQLAERLGSVNAAAAKPSTRAWAITRRADRARRLAGQRTHRAERRHADRIDRPYQAEERGMVADAR
jgi:hypothetical protein